MQQSEVPVEMEETSGRVDFAALRDAIRRRLPLVLLCMLIGTGLALGISLRQEKQYAASASLLFRDAGFDERVFGSQALNAANVDPARTAATNVELVSLRVVAQRTAADLGTDAGRVSGDIAVGEEGDSDVIPVTATDPDPDFAAKVANAFARNYVAFRRQADRKTIANAARLVQDNYYNLTPAERSGEEGRSLQKQIGRLKTLRALQTGNAEVVQRATVPGASVSPRTRRNTVVGLIVGLLFGLGLAALLERADRRLRRPEDLGTAFGLPLLGAIPDSKALASSNGTISELPPSEKEAFRMVRTRLRYFNVDREVHSVMIGSPSVMDGKSTLSLHLALAAAAAKMKSVVVEADFHRPSIAERAELSPFPGLAEVLTGQTPLDEATQHIAVEERSNGQTVERQLDVIVAGAKPPNTAELLESREIANLIDRLKQNYDLVVIDTPPLRLVADAIPLTKMVDGVIIVSQIGNVTRDEAIHLREQLEHVDAPVLGVVANRVRQQRGYYGYYYGYYGKDESGKEEKGKSRIGLDLSRIGR
jgi:succinoglycan biosynthesis transport protein ExoP